MKFVVNVPFGLYLVFAVSVALLMAAVVHVLFSVFVIVFFISRPKTFIGLSLLSLSVKFWFVTIPLLMAMPVFIYFSNKKAKKNALEKEERKEEKKAEVERAIANWTLAPSSDTEIALEEHPPGELTLRK